MNHNLHKIFLDELADIHDAEQQLVKALPKVIEAAGSDELRSAVKAHLEETKGHVDRIDQVFKSPGRGAEVKEMQSDAGIDRRD